MEGPGSRGSEGTPEAGTGSSGVAAGESIFERDHVVNSAIEAYEGRPDPAAPRGAVPAASGDGAAEPPATAALIEVAIGLQELSAKQDQLRDLFESRLRSDEVQAKAQERLHDQLREYKTNFIRQEMQPLLRDLIYCYDYAADESERATREGAPATPQETAHAFDHLRQMVADVLAKYDIEPYRTSGPDFDRREQQCVRTVPTAVEADEKKIAAVGAIGFRQADQIVRKEQVTVYKYARAAAPSPSPQPATAAATATVAQAPAADRA